MTGISDTRSVEIAAPSRSDSVRSGRAKGRAVEADELETARPWTSAELSEESSFEEENCRQIGVSDIQLIAFYFPQFHPFPENERFWGRGFTEWTNTTKSRPQFRGHYQPRLPGELGFYDLRIREVQKRQIELAKRSGISGFCYHHYWFDGKLVMHLPFDQVLADPELDFPFCLHWANEPWTVRWDGCLESGTLLGQSHTPEDDIAFIRNIEGALQDSRYIRVDGRPLLVIYRPGLFPDIRATLDRWREHCVTAGIGELYLAVMQQPFDGVVNPRLYGFDAAIEYPTANMPLVDIREEVELYDPDFTGLIWSYPHVVLESLSRTVPDYTWFRGIMPAWDNIPRQKSPDVCVNSTPDLYQNWLEGLCKYTRENLPPGERLIFINAWNEWAEGAYLEPDLKHGYAYLNRTARALQKFVPS